MNIPITSDAFHLQFWTLPFEGGRNKDHICNKRQQGTPIAPHVKRLKTAAPG
jgi:hypothetical protein